MTEGEWLVCADATPMLEFLRGKASDRKLRLFAVACCRRIWPLLLDQSSRNAVDVAERLADGAASEIEVAAASEALAVDTDRKGCGSDARENADAYAAEAASKAIGETTYAHAAAWCAAWEAVTAMNPWDADCYDGERWKAREAIITTAADAEALAQRHLLREFFGNPFRPVSSFHSWLAWNDGAIRKMAQTIYDTRAFDRLPLLADALEDAGCDSREILDHCRSGGEHVRGCWVVDLLLGKK
jgi:hypothetical protein